MRLLHFAVSTLNNKGKYASGSAERLVLPGDPIMLRGRGGAGLELVRGAGGEDGLELGLVKSGRGEERGRAGGGQGRGRPGQGTRGTELRGGDERGGEGTVETRGAEGGGGRGTR